MAAPARKGWLSRGNSKVRTGCSAKGPCPEVTIILPTPRHKAMTELDCPPHFGYNERDAS